MFPPQIMLLALFQILVQYGLFNTLTGLVLVYVVTELPLTIYLLRAFFAQIPQELEEAARIDGCGRLRTLTRVLLPHLGPAVATLAIFTFTASWNEFFWPLIVVQSSEMRTIQLLIAALKQTEAVEWGVVMAVVTLSVLPTVAIYLALQRYFQKGIVMSGLKG
jgi:ABC-type glycerol-3-phosphate transport system permease component